MVTLVVISWCAQVRPGRPRGRPVVCRLVSRQAYAGAVVIALAPLASLASSVVNFEFSGATSFWF